MSDETISSPIPKPKFSVGQVVVLNSQSLPFRILDRHFDGRGAWFYGFGRKNYVHETMIRLLTTEEVNPAQPPTEDAGRECSMCDPGKCPGGAHLNALREDGINTREQYLAMRTPKKKLTAVQFYETQAADSEIKTLEEAGPEAHHREPKGDQ